MCAYIFVRKDWKINKLLFLLMMFSMVIPFQVVMIPLISIYGGMFRLLNHRYTLIFMHLGFSVSMAVFMYHGFIKGSVPLHWRRRRTLMVQVRSGRISPSYFRF